MDEYVKDAVCDVCGSYDIVKDFIGMYCPDCGSSDVTVEEPKEQKE